MLNLALRVAKKLGADDASHMAASIAYYALFSLFPLLLGAISLSSYFVDAVQAEKAIIAFFRQYVPGSADLVEQNIRSVLQLRGAAGIASVLGLLWSGSAVFGSLNWAINRAWDVQERPPFPLSKIRELSIAAAVGIPFLLSLATPGLLLFALELRLPEVPLLAPLRNDLVRASLYLFSFLTTFAIFLLIYKSVPYTKTHWRYIWTGALLGAVLFELAKTVFLLYLNSFANYQLVYGSLASVIALLLWAYLSAFILILGAEVSSEYGRMRRSLERGAPIHSQER